MHKRLRRHLLAVATVLATVAAGLVVTPSSAAAANWDSFPSDWKRTAFFAGTPRPSFLRIDVQSSGRHGTPVQLWTTNATAAQGWVEEPASEGGFYYHPGHDRWLCLDFDGTRGSGVPLKVNNCNGSASQRWYRSGAGEGSLRIGTHSDYQYCIDVPSSNFTNGQVLQIWSCNGTAAQRWWPVGCFQNNCDRLNPSLMACDFGAITVREDIFEGIHRVSLRNGLDCSAMWTRITVGADTQVAKQATVRRLWSGTKQDELWSALTSAGETKWTPMLGRTAGYSFQSCYDATRPAGGPFECGRAWP